jgi:putative membrane protein
MFWMMIWWVAVIGLLIALAGFLFSTFGRSSESNESPKTILRRRYAAGEIDTDEYERRLAELSKTSNAA